MLLLAAHGRPYTEMEIIDRVLERQRLGRLLSRLSSVCTCRVRFEKCANGSLVIGVVAGIVGLIGLCAALACFLRQKRRTRWYRAMAEYYRLPGTVVSNQGGVPNHGPVGGYGEAPPAAPLLQDRGESANNSPYPVSTHLSHTSHSAPSSSAYSPYQIPLSHHS